jgi:hypothetical protein
MDGRRMHLCSLMLIFLCEIVRWLRFLFCAVFPWTSWFLKGKLVKIYSSSPVVFLVCYAFFLSNETVSTGEVEVFCGSLAAEVRLQHCLRARELLPHSALLLFSKMCYQLHATLLTNSSRVMHFADHSFTVILRIKCFKA